MSTGTRRFSHCASDISKSSRFRRRSGTIRYRPLLAASLSKRMEHGRQTHMISRVATSIRCRCSGSGGMVWPHRSQYSSWAAASVASLFSDSSLANRRSAEKAEKLLSPAILPSAHRARRGHLYRAAFVHEQRNGLQVQLRSVVQRPPRPPSVVAPPAARAREIRHPQLTLLQRGAATGTHITVGIKVAGQVQEQHRLAGDLLRQHAAARKV